MKCLEPKVLVKCNNKFSSLVDVRIISADLLVLCLLPANCLISVLYDYLIISLLIKNNIKAIVN